MQGFDSFPSMSSCQSRMSFARGIPIDDGVVRAGDG